MSDGKEGKIGPQKEISASTSKGRMESKGELKRALCHMWLRGRDRMIEQTLISQLYDY